VKDFQNTFIIDGCVFSEGDFKGYAQDVLTAGLGGFFLTVPFSNTGFRDAARGIARVYKVSDDTHLNLKIAKTYDDLLQCQKQSQLAIILTFQDPNPLENSLELLRVFYELGVRVIQLTYNKANYIGTGCTESVDRGLTGFGKEAVKEMNRLGILVDLSHCSYQTAMDTLHLSSVPVVFSHANVKSISNSPRNRTDEELKLLKEKKGVIGVSPWGPLCWKRDKDEQPSLEDYLDHVDYIVDLIGIDHVGFGGDNTIDHSEDTGGTKEQSLLYPAVVEEYDRRVGTDPKVRHAKGFKGIHEIQNVVDGLRKRGYKDSDISKFLGGNFLRIIKQVWR
jgi:membrane dipeptidase